MEDIPISAMFGALVILIMLSAFFSGSETGLMTLNRYRLRHRAKAGHRGSRLAEELLARPDRLLGLILLGNNLVNFSASSLTTLVALRLGGDYAIAVATGIFTLVVLIFAEVLPKTFAALHPERIAIPAAYVYYPMLKLFGWLIWLVNLLANGTLRLFGIRTHSEGMNALSGEELRTVVIEAGALIPETHKDMLLRILDLEEATVEDIMVPRNEILGIDLEDDWSDIEEQLRNSQHTRLLVFRESVDNVVGILHLRRVFAAAQRAPLDRDSLLDLVHEPYYIAENTPLHKQLLMFQESRRRIGLVVDEYGDIQGLATLEDILEEIVGEFTTDPYATSRDITVEDDGNFLVSGSVAIRAMNRAFSWELPTDGPKTLNGLILEEMETIPQPGTSVVIDGHPLEVVQSAKAGVKVVRVRGTAGDETTEEDREKDNVGGFSD
ncbi:MAG: HlyC/CorC family transporter [Gammaproteobacteria bacterium]|nr:HlyC/CorC family transporter [Gammaproteobacteria bacterium]